MKFLVSGEILSGSGMDIIRNKYSTDFLNFFKSKSYSPELNTIFAVVIFRPFDSEMKQRKRFDKAKGVFFVDLMLKYDEVALKDMQTLEVLFFQSFRQISNLMESYLRKKIVDLKVNDFKEDLEAFLNQYI